MRPPTPAGVLLAVVVALFGGMAWLQTRPVPSDSAYVGSERCARCHREEHAAWKVSQHQRMMRPVHDDGVVVADFTAEAGMRFEPTDAVWAIGGKWEQQFMGRDGDTETLLPGAWLGQVGHWEFRGWDGWQVPVPRRRCHGCHTVGLDAETGRFIEPNIGCESCHGPGEWHADTLGLGRIETGVDAQICGQCHTRGQTPDGDYFFPVGYRPGRDLERYFRFEEPSPGQNSSYWWGNGHERKRHQQYWAWRQGGHAGSLRSLREGYDGRYGAVTDDCLRCHSGDYVLAGRHKPGLEDVQNGITCAVCHNVHGELDEERVGCDTCHEGGAFYHRPERNAAHVPCPDDARVGCVDCHMPRTITIGGALILHSHRPGIVPPRDTLRYGTPSSCANGACHVGVPPQALQAALERHYGDADREQPDISTDR